MKKDKCIYLYIIPLLEILITNVVPIITIKEIADNIASNILKISPIWSNKLIIFPSAIGSHTLDTSL